MFKHIVGWKLKETAGGRSKQENALLMRERFEEIANMIDGLRHLEFGIDVIHSETSMDVVLYTEFENRAAYDAYDAHPAHKALVDFIKPLRDERRAIDYEV